MVDPEKCIRCENDFYIVQLLHSGGAYDLYIVECSECRYDFVPVKVAHFMPESKKHEKFLDAWNNRNKVK